jgi:hypothetical protein
MCDATPLVVKGFDLCQRHDKKAVPSEKWADYNVSLLSSPAGQGDWNHRVYFSQPTATPASQRRRTECLPT